MHSLHLLSSSSASASSFAVCPEGVFDPSLPCSLTWLRFIIPLSLIALSLLLLALAHLPRPVRRALRPITDIFHDPASLAAVAELPESLLRAPAADESDELDAPKPEQEEEDGGDTAAGSLSSSRPPPARTTIFSPEAVLAALNDSARSLGWRHVAFIALGAVQAAFWFAWMGWSVAYAAEGAGADAWKVWMSVGIGASWLYTAVVPLLSPSTRPYYTSALVYLSHLACSIVALTAAVFARAVHGAYPPHVSTLTLLGESLNIAWCLALLIAVAGMRMGDAQLLARLSAAGAPIQIEDSPTLWQWMTFTWVNPLIDHGWRHDLADGDVPPLSVSMQTAPVYETFARQEEAEPKGGQGRRQQRSLLAQLLRANSLDIFLDASLTVVSVVCNYAGPFLIKKILDGIAEDATTGSAGGGDRSARPRAYIYAALALLAGLAKSQADLQHLWFGRRLSVRVKNELIARIFDKALRRRDSNGVTGASAAGDDKVNDKDAKGKGKEAADRGRIVQLMAGDANRISGLCSGMYFLYGAMAEIPVACIFLYQLLGWSAFAGFAIMIIQSPLQSYLTKRNITLNRELLKARDKRISITSETVTNIKFIRFFAWTSLFEKRTREARKAEMALWVRNMGLSLLFNGVFTLGPILITLVSFISFIYLAKGELTVSVAFTSLTLFSMIRQPMAILPIYLVQLSTVYVSVKRVQDFLQEDEVPDWVSSLKAPAAPKEVDPSVAIEKATFRWHSAVEKKEATAATSQDDEDVFELADVDVEFPVGKLSLIIGPTGAGKTAMLLALLGEMDCRQGKVRLPKYRSQVVDADTGLRNSVAYCSQSPWLQHQSLKNNILFGEPFNSERYQAVLEACALLPDLDALDDGDETEIGERGLSLSGGQKARIALARAVYSYTATVLLDDVLSAVDSHTGRHLYEKCLQGPLMTGRTCILVSHHVELLLPGTDYVVSMLDGRVQAQGPPEKLRELGVLDGLVALEEATVKIVEPVKTDEKVVKEEEALGETKPIAKKAKKLVKDEERSSGSVKFGTYNIYIKACGYSIWILTLFILAAIQCTTLGERLWLKVWTQAYPRAEHLLLWHRPAEVHHAGYGQAAFAVSASVHSESTITRSSEWPSAAAHPGYYIGIYTAISLGTFFVGILQSVVSYVGAYKAANTLHNQMLSVVLRATTRWLDSTPTGRIQNRFSTDIESIDSSVNMSLRQVVIQVAALIGSIVMVVAIIPWYLAPAIFIAYGYYALSVRYLRTSRDLRRIESVKRSPIFSGFGEILDGIAIVRAFGAETRFRERLYAQVNDSQAAFYHMWMTNRWLLLRFDALGAMSNFATTVFCLSGAITAGSAGVAIVSAQGFTMGAYWISRFYGQLQQDFNSVERVAQYLELPQEPPAVIESKRPPAYWPSTSGESFLRVEDLTVKYADDLPAVLKNLSFTVKPKEKIGVVGRTGSGKSTLAMSLLRFNDPVEGRILLDGIDITSIGVDDLRSAVTYVPQEAVLFAATVRDNLDPFQEHSDEELLDALDRVQLGPSVRSAMPSQAPSRVASSSRLVDDAVEQASEATAVNKVQIKLDTEIAQGGSNLSAGQRQLLAMARAILRRSNLVIADEASSNLDHAADHAIQQTIRTEFADAVVIVIAHRLSTIVDFDRILVLSNGSLAEFDTPLNLLDREDSIFRSLCEQSGRYQELYKIAKGAARAD